MFLVDTNVISELRSKRPHRAVLAWFDATPDRSMSIAAVTLGEIQVGVERLRDRDAAKAAELESWLDSVARTWNVVPIDGKVYRLWAKLMHKRSSGLSEDAMIAATALVHNLIVVTRNVRDFAPFKAQVLNPFGYRLN